MKYINIAEYYGDDDFLIAEKLKKYSDYFNTVIKEKLPSAFIEQYLYFKGFHDWDVVSSEIIVSTYENPKNELIVSLFEKCSKTTKKIHYKNVRVFQNDFNKNHFEQWSYDEYVIDEFIMLDNNYFSHEVCFPSASSYYVEFKTIEIK